MLILAEHSEVTQSALFLLDLEMQVRFLVGSIFLKNYTVPLVVLSNEELEVIFIDGFITGNTVVIFVVFKALVTDS